MHPLTLPPILLILLSLLPILTTALPSPLLPRRPHCANQLRSTPHPRHTTNTVLWCTPNTATAVLIEPAQAVAGAVIRTILDEAANAIRLKIQQYGDGLIPGSFTWPGPDAATLQVWNSNNHQVTWGVLGAALTAVTDYMQSMGWGQAILTIYDGGREVGRGLIG